jgi:hypothetical protein
MLIGHLNQARILLGGPNLGAGRPFSLKNDHLGVLCLVARRHTRTVLFILNSKFKVKVKVNFIVHNQVKTFPKGGSWVP